MPYLLDSDWLVDYLNREPTTVQRVRELAPNGLGMSIVSYIEICEGAHGPMGSAVAASLLRGLRDEIPVLPLSLSVAERCTSLRASLRQQGKRVNQRAFDLVIAATALEHKLVLATRNVHDFEDIPDLLLLTA